MPAVAQGQSVQKDENTVSIRGCLDRDSQGFSLAGEDNNDYDLLGAASDLARHVGEAIRVRGKLGESAPGDYAIEVSSVQPVDVPAAQLSPTFRNAATWKMEDIPKYGLRLSYPRSFATNSDFNRAYSNFPVQTGVVALRSFKLGDDTYVDSGVGGGTFSFFVNPEITNRASCENFERSEPRFLSSLNVRGIGYAGFHEGYIRSSSYDLHTFQNGLCYEFAFEFDEPSGMNELNCLTGWPSEKDEWNVIRFLLAKVSFTRPEPPLIRKVFGGAPKVNSFTAADTINGIARLHQTTLSWYTQNVDYIELSYRCASGSYRVVIQEGGEGRGCGDSLDQTFPVKRSPNGSVVVNFANFDDDDPVPVVVTMTPYNGATPDRDLSKSVTVSVFPWNPLPQGAHTGAQNMTLSYGDSPGEAKTYRRQGSTMTVRWTNTEKREPCVNLFLIQEDEHGVAAYRARFGERKCQMPASSGSYTWQIPKKYLGANFHIYAEAPGGVSWALGDRFEIVPAN